MNLKRVVFEEYDVNHAALILKLRGIKVSQKDFFQYFVRLFLEDHECLSGFRENLLLNKSSLGKKPQKAYKSATQAGLNQLKSFNVSNEEVEEIFDLLEAELDHGDT